MNTSYSIFILILHKVGEKNLDIKKEKNAVDFNDEANDSSEDSKIPNVEEDSLSLIWKI